MEFTIRRAHPGDAPAINALTIQLGYKISEEQTRRNIDAILGSPDHDLFTAIHNNQVVGWTSVIQSIQVESAPLCEIRGLVVETEFRNRGIGKLLIDRARQWAREKGNSRLRLRCNVKRRETHAFYQQLGFEEIKQQTVFEWPL